MTENILEDNLKEVEIKDSDYLDKALKEVHLLINELTNAEFEKYENQLLKIIFCLRKAGANVQKNENKEQIKMIEDFRKNNPNGSIAMGGTGGNSANGVAGKGGDAYISTNKNNTEIFAEGGQGGKGFVNGENGKSKIYTREEAPRSFLDKLKDLFK